jgi:hypothetical protein
MDTKGNRKKTVIAIAVFLIVVIALYLRIYIAPKVSDIFIEDYTAEYGTLDVDADLKYLCVRDEVVHTSDAAGTVSRKALSGDLVRIGEVVSEVNGYGYAAPERGLVSYLYDGLEGTLNSETMSSLTTDALEPAKDEEGNVSYSLKDCAETEVAQGGALYKIIDSHKWYLVTWTDKESALDYEEGSRVTIELDDENKTQLRFLVYYNQAEREAAEAAEAAETAESEETSSETAEEPSDENKEAEAESDANEMKQVIFSCDRYYAGEDALRYGTARVIARKVSGIVLETSSIVEEDGVKGVYVKTKYNDYAFTPISIIEEVGDKTVVESRTFYDAEKDEMVNTVKNYDSVKKGDGSGHVDKE